MDSEVRRHAHAVWWLINAKTMPAVQLSSTHCKQQALACELYLANDPHMPPGFVCSEETDPRNCTLVEWQQSERTKQDQRQLKTAFQDCWTVSHSQNAFAHASKECRLILARGDRRGVVAVKNEAEVYAISR
ncbi:MAG: hypothetical protein AAF354_12900 [Pseudomonadota bacterium]